MSSQEFPHKAVAVGGTFDILHAGHERLLTRAFQLGEIVFVGVSGDSLVPALHKNHPVRSFARRNRDLRKFLKTRDWLRRARVVELRDPFGPATRRKSLEALVVSEETRSNGVKVNIIRRRRGLRPLRLYVVSMAKADGGKPISVTGIRRGDFDSRGRLITKRSRPNGKS